MRGFAALIAVIIMSVLLSTIALTASAGVSWARTNEIDREHAAASDVSALSCIYVALAAYAADHSYRPNQQTVYLDDTHTCTITSLNATAGAVTVRTRARTSDSAVTLQGMAALDVRGAVQPPVSISAIF